MVFFKGLFRVSFCVLMAVLPALPLSADDNVHVVLKGETIYSIARSFDVSPQELMRYNNISDPSKLQAGSRLRIPAAKPAPSGAAVPAAANGSSAAAEKSAARTLIGYQVVKNDTLYSISRRFGVSVTELRRINGLSDSYVLKAGDTLKVPGNPLPAPSAPAISASKPAPKGASAAAQPRKGAAMPVDPALRWPVTAKEMFYMKGKLTGVALTGEKSESVRSLTDGTVVSAGPYRGFGRVVIVQAGGGYLYVYGGCESISVKEGDRVGPGAELGRLGVDALSGKPELFFMVYKNNVPVDPAAAPRA